MPIYHSGTPLDSMADLGRAFLPAPGYTPYSAPSTDVYVPVRAGSGDEGGRALGSEAQVALGRKYFLANSRWNVLGAPIRQDYGEMARRELAQDWIRPKGISNQAP